MTVSFIGRGILRNRTFCIEYTSPRDEFELKTLKSETDLRWN